MMRSERDNWPFEKRWKAHRGEGRKRVAIQHPMWEKPMYLTVIDAEDLMLQIAEALGVEGPAVPMRTSCDAQCEIVAGAGVVYVRCQAWAEEHTYGKHYYRDGNVSITWTE
jgi:hypothetical protein